MREIKFRGREQDGFWTYGDLRHEGNITGIIENGIYSWVDSSTVGQYTGLRDVDGRRMYEGDIVRIDDWSSPSYIRWDDDTASFVVDRWAVNLAHVCYRKVIGNIHDNPELLEAKDA